MGTRIDTDDMIDAQGVADLLGLAQRNTVSLYQRRYADMPRPVIDLGQGRCKLWSRGEVEEWAYERGKPMISPRCRGGETVRRPVAVSP
jgi:hypothetical protein